MKNILAWIESAFFLIITMVAVVSFCIFVIDGKAEDALGVLLYYFLLFVIYSFIALGWVAKKWRLFGFNILRIATLLLFFATIAAPAKAKIPLLIAFASCASCSLGKGYRTVCPLTVTKVWQKAFSKENYFHTLMLIFAAIVAICAIIITVNRCI